MTSGLNGALVLVTRPAAQADMLCKLIERQQGVALRFPTLEIEAACVEPVAVDSALTCDWLIFTSTNAVDFALAAFSGKMAGLQRVRLAAVGQATAEALSKARLSVACVPATEFSSEGLLAEADMQNVSGLRIGIVRGVGGREKLAQTLRGRGAVVEYFEVYQRSRPDIDNTALVQSLNDGSLQAITITSGEALQNLLAMLDETSAARLRQLPVVVVSERIAQLARGMGFSQLSVSAKPNDAAILETLTTLLNGENSGRSN